MKQQRYTCPEHLEWTQAVGGESTSAAKQITAEITVLTIKSDWILGELSRL